MATHGQRSQLIRDHQERKGKLQWAGIHDLKCMPTIKSVIPSPFMNLDFKWHELYV